MIPLMLMIFTKVAPIERIHLRSVGKMSKVPRRLYRSRETRACAHTLEVGVP